MKDALQALLTETRRMKRAFNKALNDNKPTQAAGDGEMDFDLEDDDE